LPTRSSRLLAGDRAARASRCRRPCSRRTVYRIASIIARQRAIEPNTFQSMADMLKPEDVDRALDFIVARVGEDKTGDLYRVARTMHLLAEHWCGASKEDLKELANMRAAVRPEDGPADRTIELLRMFREPRLQENFLLLPEVVMAKLKRKTSPTRTDAIQAQLAVMSAILVAAPLRSANAVTLCEGVNLLRFGSGKAQQVRIAIPGDEVKNAKSLSFLLRRGVVDLIDAYDKRFRALVTKDKSGYLCPGRIGGHKRAPLLSTQLAAFTSRELGIRMTAHQWRHVVGYIFLLHNPGNYEPIRRMLGHSSIDVTQTYYSFMLDEDAQEAIDSTFDEIRQAGRMRHRRPTTRGKRDHA
jgi:integrase